MEENYYLIYNIFIKIYLCILIIFLVLEKKCHQKEVNNLEYYFSKTICQLLSFSINYKCSDNFFTNDNLYIEILEINSNVNLLMNIKKPKLENIFLFLSIIPFLKNNSTLSYKINDKGIYKFFKKILNKKIKKKVIKLDYNDLYIFNTRMKELLLCKWELIPKKIILDNLRYIINNYYNETNSVLFQKSLNMNYKLYIKNKINEMTYEEIKELLSKLIIINFIYKKGNIGIYENVKCVGLGSTGRVCILILISYYRFTNPSAC